MKIWENSVKSVERVLSRVVMCAYVCCNQCVDVVNNYIYGLWWVLTCVDVMVLWLVKACVLTSGDVPGEI